MRLAETGAAVDEEWVVGLRRHLGYRQRGGVSEAVAVADDELVEGVARVEAGGGALLADQQLASGLFLGRRLPVGLDDLDAANRAAGPPRGGSEQRPEALVHPGADVVGRAYVERACDGAPPARAAAARCGR